jgi:hypothetical protein
LNYVISRALEFNIVSFTGDYMNYPKRLLMGGLCVALVSQACGCARKYSLLVEPTVPPILNKRTYSTADYKKDLTAYESEVAGDNTPEVVRGLRDKIVYGDHAGD